MFINVGSTTSLVSNIDKLEMPIEKTLENEIDRLSNKYEIASSTVNAVIKCESQLYGDAINHNLDKAGKVWSSDKGYLQINDYYHSGPMKELGLDINNKWDSLEYGFILMKAEGLKPWSASKFCWSSKI